MKPPIFIHSVLLFACIGCEASSNHSDAIAPQKQVSTTETATKSTGHVFELIGLDGTSHKFDLKRLQALPLVTIIAAGNPQEGPSLTEVLQSANAGEFTSIEITGREGTKTISKSEVTADVILDFNNRGSVKLVSPALSHDERIRDITRIVVR